MRSGNIDIFAGDADGLCAVHQLRMTYPVHARSICSVRRATDLLSRAAIQQGDNVTVFDLPTGEVADELQRLLRRGANVTYFDRHSFGSDLRELGLTPIAGSSPRTCSSALVDRYLGGQHRVWAVVGAYGVGLDELARRLAVSLRLSTSRTEPLQQLGRTLSYNAYGETVEDCIVSPAMLYGRLARYSDPFEFMRRESIFHELSAAREIDLELLQALRPETSARHAAVYVLADEPRSRRARGELAGMLAGLEPARAHAVLAPNRRGGYAVSVRASAVRMRWRADSFCRRFGGCGEARAAGIPDLPGPDLSQFIGAFLADCAA